MTHSRDMFTFFYTWVLLQVVSNQLCRARLLKNHNSSVTKNGAKISLEFLCIRRQIQFSGTFLCAILKTVWEASNFQQRCFRMHSHRKSIITLRLYISRKFWIYKIANEFVMLRRTIFFWNHVVFPWPKKTIRRILETHGAYLIFVTGFGSPLMLVLVTMVAMMVMVHYLRFWTMLTTFLFLGIFFFSCYWK